MSGWDNIGTAHRVAEVGGVERPPLKAMCADCNRRRWVTDMIVETNPNSSAYGYLVCAQPWNQGGCFEGPQPDRTKPAKSDDMSPIKNIFY